LSGRNAVSAVSPETSVHVLPADARLRTAILAIARMAEVRHGRALVVGGAVRDACHQVPGKDFDIEVYGIAPAAVESMIERAFAVDRVGQAFGILKVKGLPIDVSLPRRESKSGLGHRGFEVLADPHMTVEEAAARRDFTVNAMAYDPLTGELLDPFGGQRDLEQGILRHTSPAFAEDPLRVLRAMQFAARFNLRATPDTVAACRAMTQDELPWERLMPEWGKLLLLGQRPSVGLYDTIRSSMRWSSARRTVYGTLKVMCGITPCIAWTPSRVRAPGMTRMTSSSGSVCWRTISASRRRRPGVPGAAGGRLGTRKPGSHRPGGFLGV